jgi:phosphoglycolate phosphatase-like HAD superfamily hydrolase
VAFHAEPLDSEREDRAAVIIDTVFDCLAAQESASLELATSGTQSAKELGAHGAPR